MNYVRQGWLIGLAFLLSGCLQEQTVLQIKAAENIRKSTEGRIFVSGREALYEIVKDEQGTVQRNFITDTAKDQCSYYGGMTELNGWLFVVCNNFRALSLKTLKFADAGRLLAYSLSDNRVVDVMPLTGFQIANGLDAIPDENAILIADEDFLGRGGVARATFDFSGATPQLIDYDQHWIGRAQKVYAANGVRVVAGDVYLTDIGYLKRVARDANGNPQPAEILYTAASVLDDLAPFCEGVLVVDFLRGKLIYVPFDGANVKATASGLNSPSAILPDATPLFEPGQLLLTETTAVAASKGNQLAMIDWGKLGIDTCAWLDQPN